MIPVPSLIGSQVNVFNAFIGDTEFYGPLAFLNKDSTI